MYLSLLRLQKHTNNRGRYLAIDDHQPLSSGLPLTLVSRLEPSLGFPRWKMLTGRLLDYRVAQLFDVPNTLSIAIRELLGVICQRHGLTPSI